MIPLLYAKTLATTQKTHGDETKGKGEMKLGYKGGTFRGMEMQRIIHAGDATRRDGKARRSGVRTQLMLFARVFVHGVNCSFYYSAKCKSPVKFDVWLTARV